MSNKKSKETNSFDLLHQLDKKLQKSKSNRENSQNKYKESKPPSRESHKRRSPSPSNRDNRDSKRAKKKESKSAPTVEIDSDVDYDIPDRSLGDFFCKLCDAHMNSENAWETHVQGKRHLKNLKKEDLDLKYDTLHEDPQIFSELKEVVEPIVGLDFCCEYQRLEGRPIYQCFLCSANVPNGKALIDHLIGTKHMMAYLKERDPTAHSLIMNTDLKKGMLEPVIRDYALNHRKKHDLGKMQVKKERLKPPVPSYYKSYKDDFPRIKPKEDRRSERAERNNKDSNWRKLSDTENDCYRRRSITPPRNYRGDYRNSSPRNADRSITPPRNYRDDYRNSPPRNVDWSHGRESYFDQEGSSKNSRLSPYDNYGSSVAEPFSSYDRDDSPYTTNLPFPRDRDEIVIPARQPLAHASSSQSQGTDTRQGDDLRFLLEQKKVKEANVLETSNSTYIMKILDIISSLPAVVFLELVRIRVKQMELVTPTEAELSLLQSVGNLMISIVMNQKMNDLPPEMLSKFVEAVKTKTSQPEAKPKPSFDVSSKSSNLSDLMSLISQLKSTPLSTSTASSKSFDTEHIQIQSTAQRAQHEPVFSTMPSTSQSIWSHQPNTSSFTYETKGIPGLTLSGSSSASPTYQLFGPNDSDVTYPPPYQRNPQAPIGTNPKNMSWPPSSTDQYEDHYNRY